MSATRLEIKDRHREHPGVIASLADFEWQTSLSMSAARLLDDPRLTLYCLDHPGQRAIFAALPDGIDPSQTPFMYQAQFDHAEFLVALPFADFMSLAEDIAPPDESLVALHNIGRCGSTVLCRALNDIDGVLALSEPEALANFVHLRQIPGAEQKVLLRASVAWLCRPAIMGADRRVLLKFRNQATGIMGLYVDALPSATHLFMYRNVIDWLASFHRLRVNRGETPTRYSRQQIIEQQIAYYQCAPADIENLAPPSISSYLSLEGRALGWLYMLESYLDLRDTGASINALRYEDLQANREALLVSALELMGLHEADLSAARRVFRSDAQAGTRFARDDARGNQVALPPEMIATVERLLAEQQVINRADFRLPGTIRLDTGKPP